MLALLLAWVSATGAATKAPRVQFGLLINDRGSYVEGRMIAAPMAKRGDAYFLKIIGCQIEQKLGRRFSGSN